MVLMQKMRNRGFEVREYGDLVLVHPSKGKFAWEPGELGFRSVILDRDGAIVSTGWPKFFNQGEWPDHDEAIGAELAAGRAIITHKHDGSLIIRSVLPDGRILLRTRDSFDGGRFAPLAEAVARAKYPLLLDPDIYPHGSMLFEYVGEENRIVVRYGGEDDLILIGCAEHRGTGVRYLRYSELADVAHVFGLRLVECYQWTEGGITGILDRVREWDRAEGVVVRSSCGQTLLKIKSAWYFAQHALRWSMTYDRICRFAIDGGIEDEAGLESALAQAGWDFEIVSFAKEHFARYSTAKAEAARIKQEAQAFLAAFDAETAGTHADDRARRKAFASRLFGSSATAEARTLAPYCFYAYDGKEAQLDATLLRHLVIGQGRKRSN